MSRMQTTPAAKASNNIYTVLSGVGLLVVLITLALTYLRWQSISDDKLFFGMF